MVGLLGAALGLGLGWMLAQGAVRLETQTINDFYFVTAVRQAALHGSDVLKGLLLGGLASVVAAAGPALEGGARSTCRSAQAKCTRNPGAGMAPLGVGWRGLFCA